MALETTKWDVSEHLDTPAAIADYLQGIIEENDVRLLIAAIGDIARAKGMSKIAKDAGLSRESLYRSLSHDSHPEFNTIFQVLQAMKLRIQVEPEDDDEDDGEQTKTKEFNRA
jgi:probable addiction module antidote protein